MRRLHSVLVLPPQDGQAPGTAFVSFGVAKTTIPNWEKEGEALATAIETDLQGLPDA